MTFNRHFINPYPFEGMTKSELIKIIQRKEKENWEMVRPIYSVERQSMDGGTHSRYVALMKYEGENKQ